MQGQMLNSMIVFATKAHAGTIDKSGMPYILHPLAVMYLLQTKDEELQCMAVGHDLMEDCGVTVDDLRDIGMSQRVISGILAVSKHKGESIESYKERVFASEDGRRIKKADLEHNSDIRRLKGITAKDIIRTIAYHQFYLELLALERRT